jgi:hypothetical protein
MTPPKMGAPRQTMRKTHSNVRVPHETMEAEQETAQREEFIDVDVIPSPRVEPASPTPVEEETQAPTMTSMEIDSHDGAGPPKQMTQETYNNLQGPKKPKEQMVKPTHTEVVVPRPHPEAGSAQQQEGLVEDITGNQTRAQSTGKRRLGPLARGQKKGKTSHGMVPMQASHTTIILPCIPEGVQATPTLLGCMEKLKYSDHDVADTGKFPEFAQQVYMDNIGTRPFGDPILQPKPWEVRLGQHRYPQLGRNSPFWQGEGSKQLRQAVNGGPPWRLFMAGGTHLNRHRVDFLHHRSVIHGRESRAVPG